MGQGVSFLHRASPRYDGPLLKSDEPSTPVVLSDLNEMYHQIHSYASMLQTTGTILPINAHDKRVIENLINRPYPQTQMDQSLYIRLRHLVISRESSNHMARRISDIDRAYVGLRGSFDVYYPPGENGYLWYSRIAAALSTEVTVTLTADGVCFYPVAAPDYGGALSMEGTVGSGGDTLSLRIVLGAEKMIVTYRRDLCTAYDALRVFHLGAWRSTDYWSVSTQQLYRIVHDPTACLASRILLRGNQRIPMSTSPTLLLTDAAVAVYTVSSGLDPLPILVAGAMQSRLERTRTFVVAQSINRPSHRTLIRPIVHNETYHMTELALDETHQSIVTKLTTRPRLADAEEILLCINQYHSNRDGQSVPVFDLVIRQFESAHVLDIRDIHHSVPRGEVWIIQYSQQCRVYVFLQNHTYSPSRMDRSLQTAGLCRWV